MDQQKMNWLITHSYKFHSDGMLELMIVLPSNVVFTEEPPHFRHLVSLKEVEGMTIEELEEHDRKTWALARELIADMQEAARVHRDKETRNET